MESFRRRLEFFFSSSYAGLFPIFAGEDDDKSPDCWICYDPERDDCGPMIHPCDCRGDVGSVHHDCLRRWLVEVVLLFESIVLTRLSNGSKIFYF